MKSFNFPKPLFISNATNIKYLTGFVGASPEEHEVYLLIYNKIIYLFTNSLYIERAYSLESEHLKVIQISRNNQISQELAILSHKLGITDLEFEVNDLNVSEFLEFKKTVPKVNLIDTYNRIENLRQIKTESEINAIRSACKLTDDCFSDVLNEIKIGVSETDLAWKIEVYIRTHGGDIAFAPIVAFNTHASQPHFIPDNRSKLTNPSLIQFDFGAKVDGYCADMSRVLFLGKPNDEITNAYTAVLAAQQNALDYLQNPHPMGNIADKLAKTTIDKAGFPPYTHSLGHSMGLSIHESPRLTINKEVKLTKGNVFSVEPATYLPGKFGIRIEDTIALTDNGMKILTQSTKEMVIL
jgi:Xaa-Pro aminopeptidase